MDKEELKKLNESILELSPRFSEIKQQLHKSIVGQNHLLESLTMALLCNGHVLLEGVPGLAKTLSIKTLSETIDADFKRVQFTPDLLPGDLIGTTIYDPKSNDFLIKKGPIFTNLLLADEINRAPAKVQAALLESMQERQVTIGQETYFLSDVFLVLATQNPIDQEGTYALPEAQLDRFMFKIKVSYPSKAEELSILNMFDNSIPSINKVMDIDTVIKTRNIIKNIYTDERIKKYIIDLVFATRNPNDYNLGINDLIEYGASPRASLYLLHCSKAYAFLQQREYVIPEDVKAIANNIL
ncbi:MAG: AAA family ATPase, partial [Candidatus Sericytochromatia bacterium]|nr:AAA family ATPase [Candidatus Sericytochromatia bacterium]